MALMPGGYIYLSGRSVSEHCPSRCRVALPLPTRISPPAGGIPSPSRVPRSSRGGARAKRLQRLRPWCSAHQPPVEPLPDPGRRVLRMAGGRGVHLAGEAVVVKASLHLKRRHDPNEADTDGDGYSDYEERIDPDSPTPAVNEDVNPERSCRAGPWFTARRCERPGSEKQRGESPCRQSDGIGAGIPIPSSRPRIAETMIAGTVRMQERRKTAVIPCVKVI